MQNQSISNFKNVVLFLTIETVIEQFFISKLTEKVKSDYPMKTILQYGAAFPAKSLKFIKDLYAKSELVTVLKSILNINNFSYTK